MPPTTLGSDVAREQVVAANVDVVFIVAAVTDLNARLLERYLTLAWESGARPVLLVTKADLVPDPDTVTADIAGLGVPVHRSRSARASGSTTSARTSLQE